MEGTLCLSSLWRSPLLLRGPRKTCNWLIAQCHLICVVTLGVGIEWSVGWLFVCLVGWLIVWLFGWLVGYIVGWLFLWLFGCLDGWLIICLVDWLDYRYVHPYCMLPIYATKTCLRVCLRAILYLIRF